jgi:alpha-glucosidase (family GH31 glycosyl hydrolase)
MQWLHEQGLRVTLNIHPADGVRAHEEAYKRLASRLNINAAAEDPVPFDAANSDFLDAYFDEVLHPMEDDGVDFWWLDWQQGGVAKMPGLDPLWILNHFHYLDSSRRSGRPLTFSRYAGLGSHRYPVGFSGDTVITWESLDFQPYFTATASNAGYGWWSHDIGGHMNGCRDDELATRWLQLGVFSPVNRLHSTNNPFNGKEPWRFPPACRSIMSDFLRLRHALIPYLHTMNRRSSVEGEPLVQPLYYAEPDNNNAYEHPNEYYFGTELLCCPITKPEDFEAQASPFNAWLPAGIWIDFFSNIVYGNTQRSSGRVLELWRPLDTLPALAKAGAIVPLSGTGSNSVANPDALIVNVFAGADGRFSLWEEIADTEDASSSGDNNAADNAGWAETAMVLDWAGAKFTVNGVTGNIGAAPPERRWTFRFRAFAETTVTVSVCGTPLLCETAYDEACLTVMLPPVASAKTIQVTFGKCALKANDTDALAFAFLDKAQIAYDTKTRAYETVRDAATPLQALAGLAAMKLPPAVLGALTEILSA